MECILTKLCGLVWLVGFLRPRQLLGYTVIMVFCGRNGKLAAAKFAPFRYLLQILLLFMKNLSFHHFKTEVVF